MMASASCGLNPILGGELVNDLHSAKLLGVVAILLLEAGAAVRHVDLGQRRIAHALGQVRRLVADHAQHVLRRRMALRRRHGEELRRERIVADDSAAVGVHPAEAVLRLGVTEAGRLAVELDGARRVARQALAVLVAAGLGAQLREALECRRVDFRNRHGRQHQQQRADEMKEARPRGPQAGNHGQAAAGRLGAAGPAKRATYHGIATRSPSANRVCRLVPQKTPRLADVRLRVPHVAGAEVAVDRPARPPPRATDARVRRGAARTARSASSGRRPRRCRPD